MHDCAVPSCRAQVRAGLLMCPPHWRRVTEPTQREVYQTWRAFQNRPEDGSGSIAALHTYQAAVDAAIAQASPRLALVDKED